MRRSISLRGAAATALVFATCGCSSVSSTIFPEQPPNVAPATAVAVLPSAGTAVFAPVAVTPGTPSGTPQGTAVAGLRTRLTTVQSALASRNNTILEIRQKAAAEGALYRISKSDALASGSPPNPAKLSAAQTALERFAAETAAMDGEVKVFAKGAADANRLMSEADAIRGGTDEDEKQLNRVRGEIGQTANQVDKLVTDLSTENAMQSAFLAKERAALADLGGNGTTATPGVAVLAQAVPASPAILAAPAFVTIKFDRPNMSYRDALSQAVTAALRRKPDATFDVVGVVAPRSSPDDNLARTQEVGQTLTTLGVNAGKVHLMTGISPAVSTPEVRIYAR